MRIFCAVRHSIDPRKFYGGLWSGNFYPALRELGYEIIESHVDLYPLSRFMSVPGDFTKEELAMRAEITQRIIDRPNLYHPLVGVERKRAACFIGQRYADRDRWLADLHNANVPFDVYGSGWNNAAEIAEDFSAPDKVYLGRKQYRPASLASYARAVRENIEQEGLFGGLSRTAKQWQYRRETQRLMPAIIAHAKGRAEDISTTFAAYEVCLNFSNVWSDGRPGSKLIPHVRLRDFEGPMSRTCYLTGHTDEIGTFYEVGKEIETYRTANELIEKTRFYLDHPESAERLRSAGYARAKRDHTWQKRFQELFDRIGLRKS